MSTASSTRSPSAIFVRGLTRAHEARRARPLVVAAEADVGVLARVRGGRARDDAGRVAAEVDEHLGAERLGQVARRPSGAGRAARPTSMLASSKSSGRMPSMTVLPT